MEGGQLRVTGKLIGERLFPDERLVRRGPGGRIDRTCWPCVTRS